LALLKIRFSERKKFMKKKSSTHTQDNQSLSRREVLKYGLGAASSMLLPHPWILRAEQAASVEHTTVLLFLRGAIDPLALVAPLAESPDRKAYDLARPKIGLKDDPSRKLLRVARESKFGIHPATVEMQELMNAGKMKVLIGCGSLHPTTSHFEQQDNMERGYGATHIAGVSTGVLNRALGQMNRSDTLPSVTVGTVLDKSLQGPHSAIAVPNLGSTGLGAGPVSATLGMDQRITESWIQSDVGSAAENAQQLHAKRALNALATIRRAAKEKVELSPLTGAMDVPGVHYAGYGQLQSALRLIQAEPKLRFITASVGGSWDDHFNLGANGGNFEARVAKLSRALGAFMTDLEKNGLANKVTVVVLSEFGRNVTENVTLGSDHGRGGAAMVLDASMTGGSGIFANGFTLDKNNPDIQRNVLPVTYDYRQVLAEVLTKRMGATKLDTVFPGLTGATYSLLRVKK
jgi:uncharacterized protein (DUF1501 family)